MGDQRVLMLSCTDQAFRVANDAEFPGLPGIFANHPRPCTIHLLQAEPCQVDGFQGFSLLRAVILSRPPIHRSLDFFSTHLSVHAVQSLLSTVHIDIDGCLSFASLLCRSLSALYFCRSFPVLLLPFPSLLLPPSTSTVNITSRSFQTNKWDHCNWSTSTIQLFYPQHRTPTRQPTAPRSILSTLQVLTPQPLRKLSCRCCQSHPCSLLTVLLKISSPLVAVCAGHSGSRDVLNVPLFSSFSVTP